MMTCICVFLCYAGSLKSTRGKFWHGKPSYILWIDVAHKEVALKNIFILSSWLSEKSQSHTIPLNIDFCGPPKPYETSVQSGVPLGISGGSCLQRQLALVFHPRPTDTACRNHSWASGTDHKWSQRQSPRDECCSPRYSGCKFLPW